MMMQNFLFLCDDGLRVNCSAPDMETALTRLTMAFDKIAYLGINPDFEPYEYEPRSATLMDSVRNPVDRVSDLRAVTRKAIKKPSVSNVDDAKAAILAGIARGMM